MSESVLLDVAGRRRSPATLPGHHAGRVPRNKGQRYPADPPTVEEIVAVMRQTTDDRHGYRVRTMIVVLWRAGLRVHEALSLLETDLDQHRGSLLVRKGKGGRRRDTGMDAWGWEQLRPCSPSAPSCRSGRCSASSMAPPAAAAGPVPVCASRFTASRPMPESAGDLRRTSSATPTPSSSPTKAWP